MADLYRYRNSARDAPGAPLHVRVSRQRRVTVVSHGNRVDGSAAANGLIERTPPDAPQNTQNTMVRDEQAAKQVHLTCPACTQAWAPLLPNCLLDTHAPESRPARWLCTGALQGHSRQSAGRGPAAALTEMCSGWFQQGMCQGRGVGGPWPQQRRAAELVNMHGPELMAASCEW